MILLKKAIRSMLRHKKAYISCIVLMAIGVWTYAVMNTALVEIENGKIAYYEDKQLGDAFATVNKIPRSALSGLEEIEGIKQVDGRLITLARVMIPDYKEDSIRLKLISTVAGQNEKRLNAYEQTGNDIQNIEDIVIGYDFYNAYAYKPGAKIKLLLNQKYYDFVVQGYIYSPEYVYIVENPNDLFSDTTKYNVAYLDESTLMSILGMEGMYNDLSFSFKEGYTYDDVKDELHHKLKKYGLITLYERDDLFSYMMLEEEISGGKSMSTTLPMVFVSMAAIVLYLMLRRIIEQDRTQIGTLKAFGYSDRAVLWHYVSYGLITGSVATIIALGLSYLSISPYIQIYLDYYKLPIDTRVTSFGHFYIGGMLSIVGGGVGAYFGARNVIQLSPADAMRPKAPKPIKNDIGKMLPFLKYILNSRGFMAVRNINRNKVRSGVIIIGIVFSYSMITMIGMMSSLMDNMFFNQFNHVLKYDAEMVLAEEVPYDQGVMAAMNFEEITYAEGILKLPMAVYKGHKESGTTVIGIKKDNYLYKLYDDELKTNIAVNDYGVVLGSMVADALAVNKGDSIYLSSPYFKEDQKVVVWDIVNQSIGAAAYMDLEFLSELLDRDLIINSVIFESKDTTAIREKLIDSEAIKKIEDKAKTLEMYESLLGSFSFIIFIMQGVAMIIGFAIIYNTAVISLSERSREYATLRVLGLSVNEVREIMSFEYWLLCFMGIVIGIPFTKYLNQLMVNMIDVDAFSWPTTIPLNAYIVGAIGCVIAVVFSNYTAVRTIKKLDLVEVLKERE